MNTVAWALTAELAFCVLAVWSTAKMIYRMIPRRSTMSVAPPPPPMPRGRAESTAPPKPVIRLPSGGVIITQPGYTVTRVEQPKTAITLECDNCGATTRGDECDFCGSAK